MARRELCAGRVCERKLPSPAGTSSCASPKPCCRLPGHCGALSAEVLSLGEDPSAAATTAGGPVPSGPPGISVPADTRCGEYPADTVSMAAAAAPAEECPTLIPETAGKRSDAEEGPPERRRKVPTTEFPPAEVGGLNMELEVIAWCCAFCKKLARMLLDRLAWCKSGTVGSRL